MASLWSALFGILMITTALFSLTMLYMHGVLEARQEAMVDDNGGSDEAVVPGPTAAAGDRGVDEKALRSKLLSRLQEYVAREEGRPYYEAFASSSPQAKRWHAEGEQSLAAALAALDQSATAYPPSFFDDPTQLPLPQFTFEHVLRDMLHLLNVEESVMPAALEVARTALELRDGPTERDAVEPNGAVVTVIIPTECDAYGDWLSVFAMLSLDRLRRQALSQALVSALTPGASATDVLDDVLQGRFVVRRLVACGDVTRLSADVLATGDGDHLASLVSPYPGPINKGYEYPPLNKPHVVQQYLTVGGGASLPGDHRFLIVDPDFLFVRRLPLTSPTGRLLGGTGAPFSATYNIGFDWFLGKPEVASLCGEPCERWLAEQQAAAAAANPSASELQNRATIRAAGVRGYDVGCPYFLSVSDALAITPHWLRLTEAAVQLGDPSSAWGVPGGWIVEMYAYAMGAMLARRPHSTRLGLMASVWEGPEWQDVVADVQSPPPILHYCQAYNVTTTAEAYVSLVPSLPSLAPSLILTDSSPPRRGAFYFQKHDWHEREGGRVWLACDGGSKVEGALRRTTGDVAPPAAIVSPLSPPPLTLNMLASSAPVLPPDYAASLSLSLSTDATAVALADRAHRRMLWFSWHMLHGPRTFAAEWRRRTCP
jgi:hypothetical protein